MTKYKVYFTMQAGTDRDRQIISVVKEISARDDAEAYEQAITEALQEHPGAGNPQLKNCEAIAWDVSATKQQEREALEEIKYAVKCLGPDSYVAAAFKGCFTVAESNIDNDFLESWFDRCEARGNEVARLKTQLVEETSKKLTAQHDLEELTAQLEELKGQKTLFPAQLKGGIGVALEASIRFCTAWMEREVKRMVEGLEDGDTDSAKDAAEWYKDCEFQISTCEALLEELRSINAKEG